MFSKSVSAIAIAVLVVCVYSFLVGNGVFVGRFDNDAIGWYFLAKGMFCSVALYLLALITDKILEKK